MSVNNLIMTLLSGVKDVTQRVDIATTIRYFLDLYSMGGISEEDLRKALYEVCFDVLSFTIAELTTEEIKEKAKNMTEEFIKAFKVESIMRRAMSKYKVPFP
ncbi:MAG: hypothetical protein QXY65_02890 [Candidatus Methanomethylicaceae archaeon]